MTTCTRASGVLAVFGALVVACIPGCRSKPEVEIERFYRPVRDVSLVALSEPSDSSESLRPIDAIVEGQRLWLALECLGEAGTNIRTSSLYAAFRVHDKLRSGDWIIQSSRGRVRLAWNPRDPWHGPPPIEGSSIYPQVPLSPELNHTVFWIWVWFDGDAPNEVSILPSQATAGEARRRGDLVVVGHDFVQVRQGVR